LGQICGQAGHLGELPDLFLGHLFELLDRASLFLLRSREGWKVSVKLLGSSWERSPDGESQVKSQEGFDQIFDLDMPEVHSGLSVYRSILTKQIHFLFVLKSV
jgi:hypothetical protein